MATDTAIATGKPVEAELVVDDPNARVPMRITTPTQYRASMEAWQKQSLNILSPATNFSGLPEGWSMVPAVVRINPDPEAGEVYRDKLFCKADEVAITKNGLSKIAQAAGMSIKTFRTDDRSIPHYWEMQATVRFFGLDGTIQELTATQEWDLRDGSPRAAAMNSLAERQRSRVNGLRSCEARAINAAIRLFGVRQKYHVEDVAKPFMCVRVMYEPDRSDPEIRKMIAERAMQGTSAMYGGPVQRAAEPELTSTIGANLDEGAPVAAAASSAAAGAETKSANAVPDGYGLIPEKPVEKKITKTSGGTFSKWLVTDFNGVTHVTTKKVFADSLFRCFEERTPVEILSEENDYNENVITEITPLGAAKRAKLPNKEDL